MDDDTLRLSDLLLMIAEREKARRICDDAWRTVKARHSFPPACTPLWNLAYAEHSIENAHVIQARADAERALDKALNETTEADLDALVDLAKWAEENG